MSNFDDLKLAVEALSGGKNTVLFDDDLGTGGESFPSIMVRIPQFTSLSVLAGAPDAPHSMFASRSTRTLSCTTGRIAYRIKTRVLM